MVEDLKDSYGIILGGSSGLGLASARKLAQHGMNLILIYRDARMNEHRNQQYFEEVRSLGVAVHAFNMDATREDKVVAFIHALEKDIVKGQKIRLLLHSIAKGNLKPLTGTSALTTADLNQTLHSMASSLYTWTQFLSHHHLFARHARILAFTSEGSSRPVPEYAAVSMAKAALEALVRSLALELADQKITANCIQAGVTQTPSLDRIPNSAIILKQAQQRNPSGRLTQPEDIAGVVYLMCRPESRWINGTIIKVDGGESLQ